jgi:transposase-like protein
VISRSTTPLQFLPPKLLRHIGSRLGVRIGEDCARLHDRMIRDLNVAVIECDEQWDYIAKKQKRVREGDPAEFGDVWLHVAISATHKAVFFCLVGKRDGTYTQEFALDLRSPILNRPQITADGYAPYIRAIEAAFGTNVDFATITKKYVGDSNLPDAAHRHSRLWRGADRDKRTPKAREYLNQLR